MSQTRKNVRRAVKKVYRSITSTWPASAAVTTINKARFVGRKDRKLEIGPGAARVPGFETLSIVGGLNVDYIVDASQRLPFSDGTFCVIYASHVLEHVPWFLAASTLKEWKRVLQPGGVLEVCVPDALRICETLVAFERNGVNDIHKDGWYKFNPEKDPCVWAAGRLFTYGDGSARPSDPNWHRSLYTPRYLKKLFADSGLQEIREMTPEEIRGHDHGWINLGVRGVKP